MMDGYAGWLASAGKTIPVIGEIAAGQCSDAAVSDEACVAIATRAPCPPQTEAVVQKEHARYDNGRVTLPAQCVPGSHIAAPGSDCRAGQVIAERGRRVTGLGHGCGGLPRSTGRSAAASSRDHHGRRTGFGGNVASGRSDSRFQRAHARRDTRRHGRGLPGPRPCLGSGRGHPQDS